ncbi:hypothetical protein TanjilG_14535 [Lupinus angustifolius]|uniref:Uncharacterized protein n=1 Tax=Lupinus angustifolius TaxID=3871 RepID=A0A1J7G4H6_LUPAN|nr:hypothetical protein TanjilG_14535 [Lupinus angustifolius]
MDSDFPSSLVIIDNDESWNEFCSDMLPTEEPISQLVDNDLKGFLDCEPMVQNSDISDNNVDSMDQEQVENYSFDNCMEQVELWKKRTSTKYKEKESALNFCKVNQDFLLEEIKRRDETIARLQQELDQEKSRNLQCANQHKRDLFMMGKLVNDYREQNLKINRKFKEYRSSVQNLNGNLGTTLESRGPVLNTEGHALTFGFN